MFSFAVACVLLSVMQSRERSSGLTLAPHPVASHLLLISTLARLGDSRDQAKSRETVAKIAEGYLGRDWRSATEKKEEGDIFNTQVEKILTVFLASSRNVVGVMEVLCKDGVAKYALRNYSNSSSSFFFIL